MITLHTFGPKFGVPDPSPFCLKAIVLLKMSGLAFETAAADIGKAPKGKAPYMVDGAETVADSTFIRRHLETRHGIDFDAGYGPGQLGAAWAVEKLVEDNLYWALVRERWLDDANFKRGPVQYFAGVPAIIKPLVLKMVLRKVRRNLQGQGLGRHSDAEVAFIANRGSDAISDILGDRPFLLGDTPCGADAAVFGWIANALSDTFVSPLREHVLTQPNLVAYRDRGMARWFAAA